MIPVFSVKKQRQGVVTRARFSPAVEDCRAMCIESCGDITLIDLEAIKYTTGNTYEYTHSSVTGFTNYLLDFSFTADGRLAFIGDSFGNVTVDAINNIGNHISGRRGKLITVDNAHQGGVFAVLPSPSYEFLLYTGGGDGMIRVWDTRFMIPDNPLLAYRHKIDGGDPFEGDLPCSRKPLHELWAHKNAVSSICFPDDQTMISSGIDENMRLWETGDNAVIATIRSYGEALGIWDIAINKALGRVVVVGQSTDIWAYYINDFLSKKKPESYEMVSLDVDDRVPADSGTFSRWRRICTYGKNVIIPTLNNQLGAKLVIVDVETGSQIYSLTTNIIDRIHTVDAHPRLSAGLILAGGVKNRIAVTTLWMDEQGMCPISV